MPNEGQPGPPPPILGAEHRYVDAGGLRVHYAEAGSGPPLLLLHGWPQHHYLWRGMVERLGGSFRLIAPDLRGFGWTEAPGHGYDGETFARDQVALLDALEIEKASVMGHDWGGWTTFLLGLNHPERVHRAVAVCCPHPWPPMSPRIAVEQIPRGLYALANATPGLGSRLHRHTDLVKLVLKVGSGSAFTDAEAEIYANAYRDPARADATSALYRYYLSTSRGLVTGPGKGRLTVPTLLMAGERDPAFSRRLIESGWQDNADDMRLEWLDSAHFAVDETPDEVAARSLEFLSA